MTKTPEDIAREIAGMMPDEGVSPHTYRMVMDSVAAALRSYADERLRMATNLIEQYDYSNGRRPASIKPMGIVVREITALVRSLKSDSPVTR